MRNRKVTHLLILLVFPIVYGIKIVVGATPQQIMTPADLPRLIRDGYDLVDDSCAFSKLCTLLNDSLLLQEKSLKMAVFTDVNLQDSTINWCLLCYTNESELLKVSDRYFFNIDLYKGGHIKALNVPIQLSDIRSSAKDYIFYPDSINIKRIFTKRNINQKDEIDVSGAGVYMKVHIKDNNGFSVSDWRVFYNCLYELVNLFEDQRNEISLKIWNEDYDSLSFKEREDVVDLAGYRINIEFK